MRDCPDGGRCHHNCAPENCFRVGCCGPFSNTYPNDEWPEHLTFDWDLHELHLKSQDVIEKLES